VTALQEGIKITVVLIDNGGFGSIGGLSASLGSEGFGTRYRFRGEDGQLSGPRIPVDFVANAASLGAHAIRCRTIPELLAALAEARSSERTTVIVIETDPEARVGSYESWWDVPPAEVSDADKVRAARSAYEEARRKERWLV
jgi:3D-(3,5/4)-trihydroxycyclohexane-1,2-dione acylhydrolase (decyclizing)